MREIKFRAWDKKTKKILYPDTQEIIILSDKGVFIDIEEFVPMQYTGLKDKNGKEIYEGDIVRTIGGVTKEVAFDKYLPGFAGLVSYQGEVDVDEEEIEVIGNIYEHGHLLDNTDTKV